MIRVTFTGFGEEVGRYQDAALAQPGVVTRNGLGCAVLGIEDFTAAEVEAIRRIAPSPEADTLNHEMNI